MLRELLATKRLPEILVSDQINSPVAAGAFRGVVILPARLVKKINSEQLCDVLLHECAHHPPRSADALSASGRRQPVLADPAGALARRQLSSACEEICDNYVLAHRDPLHYAETLLCVATLVGRMRPQASMVGMLQWRGKLEARIAGLIDQQRRTRPRASPHSRAGLCLGTFLLISGLLCGTTIRPIVADASPATALAAAKIELPAAPVVAAPPAEAAVAQAATVESEAPAIESAVTEPQSVATQAAEPQTTEPQSLEPQAAEPPVAAGVEEPKPVDGRAGRRRVRLWWAVGGRVREAFEQQVERFNTSQDRIVVTVRPFNGYGNLHPALAKAVVDGTMPDLAVIETHHMAPFAAEYRLALLDHFVASDPNFHSEDLLPGIMSSLYYRDKLYALPVCRSTPVLYYNKDRFTAVGLDPDKPPQTWDEVRDAAKTLTVDPRTQFGFVTQATPWVFESLVWSHGGELLVDGTPVFAQSAAGPLQIWADMVHIDRRARFSGRANMEFLNGTAAMAIESAALLQAYRSQTDFEVGVAALPRSQGFQNTVPMGGGVAVIPSTIGAAQAAAYEFLSWFMSSEETAEWSRATGYLPVRESARAALAAEGFYQRHPEFEVSLKQLPFAREAPLLPKWVAFSKIIGQSVVSIVRDDAPALDTLRHGRAAGRCFAECASPGSLVRRRRKKRPTASIPRSSKRLPVATCLIRRAPVACEFRAHADGKSPESPANRTTSERHHRAVAT